MKSLVFSLIIYLRENKFQGTLWEYEKTKVKVTQRSPWNSMYVTLSYERDAITFLLMLLVDWLMKEDYLYLKIALLCFG